MKKRHALAVAAVALLAFCSGCHHRTMVRPSGYGPAVGPQCGVVADPAAPPPVAGQVAAAPAPAAEKSFVDRHPILAAPRNYFRDSGDNLLVKTFYGTVVGIPVGVAREAWQIIYGQ